MRLAPVHVFCSKSVLLILMDAISKKENRDAAAMHASSIVSLCEGKKTQKKREREEARGKPYSSAHLSLCMNKTIQHKQSQEQRRHHRKNLIENTIRQQSRQQMREM